MENADCVARSKSLIQRTSRTAVLIIVILAALSSNAARGGAVVPVVLPAGGVQCNGAGGDLQFGTPPCPNSTGVSQLATGSNNIQGVKLYTGGAVSYLPSADPSILSISTDGLLNGTINSGTVIPLSYDFSLAQSSGTVTGWTLDYILADSRLGGECRRVIWTRIVQWIGNRDVHLGARRQPDDNANSA